KEIAKRIDGYLIWSAGDGAIRCISLPELKETVVGPFGAPNEDDIPTIHALSGPDNEGRIAYIEDHSFVQNTANRRHLLKIIHIDGTGDTSLFSRPGDAMWARGDIGHHLALAPTGGKVALLNGLSHVQMPQALFSEG